MSDGIRAVRCNNPGNIEVGDPWQGLMPPNEMTPDQADEKRFCVFKAPKWGFRALARVLITYQDKHAVCTIAGSIARWAPSSENDTVAYVRHVAQVTHRQPNETMDFHTWDDLAPVVKAIATHECGGWFFDDDDLEAGLRLAGVEPPAKALVASRTISTASAAAATTGLGMVTEVTRELAPSATFLKDVSEYAPFAAGFLVIALLGYIIYARVDDWKRAVR